jgi:hypothetical protein
MQAYDSTDRKDSVTTDDLADRTQRALTEYLTVLDDVDAAAGADDLYAVVSESGSQYLVDARTDSCECPDAEHRDPEGGCKHARRVAFATGERPIPAAADGLNVDPQLGAHVDGRLRFVCDHGREFCAETPDARDDAVRCADCTAVAAATGDLVADGGSDIIEAGGGGEILDDESDDVVDLGEVYGEAETEGPVYTYHTEPAYVGGARYVRCELCGSESVPADPDEVLHDEECPERREWR